MATNMADDGESLESWLNKATNPSNREEDWEYIMGFCDQISKELEGPQISVRLLAHKIQSPQEWEAMQALTVLEACMKNCGQRFHNEVGKFKFLNELIKVVSPKYLGDKVSEKVKRKVIEMLYAWTVSLPDEAKICEAYQMLKSQGIVSADPEISADAALLPSPSARPKNPVFDDKKKSMRLAELLKSKKPEDLQEANRLIKNMVKEDEVRTQKEAKQKSTLEAVNNSLKLLNEMLAQFSPEDSTEGDMELIKELYSDCDKHRQTLFKLATETEDNDSSLGDILQASDDISHVINSYKRIVERSTINGDTDVEDKQKTGQQASGSTNQSEVLIDLLDLDIQSPSPLKHEASASSLPFPTDLLCGAAEPQSDCVSVRSAALSLLDEELLSLGPREPDPVLRESGHGNKSSHLESLQGFGPDLALLDTTLSTLPSLSTASLFLDALSPTAASGGLINTSTYTSASNSAGLVFNTPPVSAALDSAQTELQQTELQQAFAQPDDLPQSFMMATSSTSQQLSSLPGVFHSTPSLSHSLQDLPMLDLSAADKHIGTPAASLNTAEMERWPTTKSLADDKTIKENLTTLPLIQTSPVQGQDLSLASVFVPLEAIKPSQVCPVTVYDRNGIRVLLHFATDCPPGRPDVLVMVVSMLNTAPQPVRSVVLQAAVPKVMKVKLQPPSGTELAPFNPIHPPAAITQVMLLANPLKEKVRMRFKLAFKLGQQPFTEVGEVDGFPPAERWGTL